MGSYLPLIPVSLQALDGPVLYVGLLHCKPPDDITIPISLDDSFRQAKFVGGCWQAAPGPFGPLCVGSACDLFVCFGALGFCSCWGVAWTIFLVACIISAFLFSMLVNLKHGRGRAAAAAEDHIQCKKRC